MCIRDSDWVESCTVVGELEDGTLEIIKWTEFYADTVDAAVRTASNVVTMNDNAAA